mgnify:FL=1
MEGYKLVVTLDLAIKQPSQEEATPTPVATPSANLLGTQSAQFVRIGQTPNNFLRVRDQPSLSAKEIARVKTGETFPVVEEQSGWFKILLPDDIEGWVSKQFAEKVPE